MDNERGPLAGHQPIIDGSWNLTGCVCGASLEAGRSSQTSWILHCLEQLGANPKPTKVED